VQTGADRTIAGLAERQHGVVARRQLLTAGVTVKAIEVRLGRGSLLVLHRGVYAVGHRRLRREGHWLAAVLAVGPGAVLSHRDAAALHGIRPSHRSRIDVTSMKERWVGGIDVHHTRTLERADVAAIERIPVTTVARTLVDLAAILPSDHVRKALREADRRNVLDVCGIERALARTQGRRGPGHQTMRTALQEYAPLAAAHTQSTLEDDFLRLVHQAGLPLPQTNVPLHGHVVDALWLAKRVVVELDGYANHHTRHAFQQDRARDRALTLAGHRVLRYTYADVTGDSERVLVELRRALAP
jgi:very-short-patch-repair endonuclease/predicted transcriptional regulator of viral defense system